MKRTVGSYRFLGYAVLTAMIVFTLAAPAQAKWYWLHGSGGDCPTGLNLFDGLYDELPPSASHIATFAILSPWTKKTGARYIKLNFETSGSSAQVTEIKVYNGNVLKEEFLGLSYSGLNTIKLDLGKMVKFGRGMLIGVRVRNNSGLSTYNIQYYSAGANFVTW
jgi:hypothetical protein